MNQQTKRHDQAERLARVAMGLGWFSVGLGLAELTAPRAVARLIGVHPDDEAVSVLRAFGARQFATGVAILAEPDRATWLWGRVGGDAVDFMSLLQAEITQPGRTAAAAAAVLGITALDVICAQQLSRTGNGRGAAQEVEVVEAITVNRPIEEVYGFWRRFENFPRFMRHIESIETTGRRSRWRAIGPAGVKAAQLEAYGCRPPASWQAITYRKGHLRAEIGVG